MATWDWFTDVLNISSIAAKKMTACLAFNGTKNITKKTAFVYHDIKHALELETYIGDFDTFCHMLDLLGFKMVKEIHKHRVSYILEDIHYDIDMW